MASKANSSLGSDGKFNMVIDEDVASDDNRSSVGMTSNTDNVNGLVGSTQDSNLSLGSVTFSCAYCPQLFKKRSACYRHMKKKHDDSQSHFLIKFPFKCHVCNAYFIKRNQCLAHLKDQHEQEFASLLDKDGMKSDEDEDESTATGTEKRKTICALCLRHFWSTRHFLLHTRRQIKDQPYKCEVCQRTYSSRDTLNFHRNKIHNLRAISSRFSSSYLVSSSSLSSTSSMNNNDVDGNMVVLPDVSSNTNISMSSMRKHLDVSDGQARSSSSSSTTTSTNADANEGEQRLWISHGQRCSSSTSSITTSTNANANEGERRLWISHGQRCSSSTSSLSTSSTTDDKTVIRPYKCNLCHKAYIRYGWLKAHLEDSHGQANSPFTIQNDHITRPYKCRLCHNEYIFKGNFKMHLKKSHGLQNNPSSSDSNPNTDDYKCNFCDNSYISRGNLNKHFRKSHRFRVYSSSKSTPTKADKNYTEK